MSGIRTVLFDVGGVLLTNGWDHAERNVVLGHFQVEREEFERRHPAANDLWEKDQISLEQYLEETVFWKPRDFSAAEFYSAMEAQSVPVPNTALAILGRLSASKSVKLGILNNEARALNDYRLNKYELRPHFEVFFSSCYVRLRKPDPLIYRLAVDVLQQDPATIAFIDDREKNTAPAAQLGMYAIHYKGPEQLEKELKNLDIRF